MRKGKLIQKLGSIVLVLMMCVTIFSVFGTTNSYAALQVNSDDFNWWIRNDGANVNNWNCSVETVDGSYAMHIVNSAAVSDSGKSIQIINPYAFANMPIGKGYKVVFDMKGFNPEDTKSMVLIAVNRNSALSELDETKTAADGRDGWYTYSFSTKSLDKSNLPGLFFKFSDAYACDLYIDNVHLYATDDNGDPITAVDYIEDGTFESGKALGYKASIYTMKDMPTVSGWNIYGANGAKYDSNATKIEQVLEKNNARGGNGSLRVVRKGANNQNTSPMLRLQTENNFAAGTYTLSFYAKTTTLSKTGIMIQLSDSSPVTLPNFTKEIDAEHAGWTKYSSTFTSKATGPLKFMIYDEIDGYIDDITLTDASGDNKITNGTFDVDLSNYEPQNPFIISTLQSGGVNNISWRNPTSGTLTKVSMYKLESGRWNLVSDAYSIAAGKVFEEYDSNLDKETIYTYKLRFDFSDSESREVVLSKKPTTVRYEDRKAGNSWGITDRATDTKNQYFLPNNVTVDRTEKASGTASLHIFTNKVYDAANRPDVNGDNWTTSYFSRLQQRLATTEKGKYYRLSYKIKVNNATAVSISTKRIIIGGGASDATTLPYETGSTNGWVEKSVDLYRDGSGEANGPFQWYLGSDDVQDLWIDDITLYELTGKDGTVVENAVNHITDGGFEDYTAAEPVSGQQATAGNKSVSISWTAPSDGRYMRVYEVTDSGDVLRAVCEPSANGVTIENLTNNEQHTFKLESQNKNGVLSDAVTVSATPTPPPYEIESDYGFKLNGTEASEISGNGTYSISLDVTNYTENNFAPVLIAALYKDDILIECNKSDALLPADEITKTLNADVNISNYDPNSRYEISAFFWSGFDEMNPLLRSVSWGNK